MGFAHYICESVGVKGKQESSLAASYSKQPLGCPKTSLNLSTRLDLELVQPSTL